MTQPELIFLKLGGSLITDKEQAKTARLEVLDRISAEIAHAKQENPDLRLLIGHGSGSYGHAVANQYQTQNGGSGDPYWHGFADVWRAARELNQIVIHTLAEAGLPVMAFPPSAGVIAKNKSLENWDTKPLKYALSRDLIPVVNGDVVFDTHLGGTIFSTEQIFQYLAGVLHPNRILLAGLDAGIYTTPQQPQDILPRITSDNISEIMPVLSGSKTVDVTGGMRSKVQLMLSIVKEIPSVEVQVFSGAEPGNIKKALSGKKFGTLITN